MPRNKLLYYFLFVFSFSLISIFSPSFVSAYSGSGGGTSGSPYLITSCSQLQEINNAISAQYKQTQNIDCNGVSFTPLASSGFSGTLDGQGYTISNITISGGSSNYQALFGHTSSGAVIKNVHLSGGSITTTGNYAASFIGYVNGATTIQDSSSSMSIVGASTGGFIGTTNGSFSTTITRSSFTGNLTSSSAYLGGFIAVMLGGSTTISDSYTSGTYTGTEYVGGLVGYLTGATISNSYSSASIIANGSDFVGGLAGVFTGTISNSFSAASVGGTSTNKGGISGQSGTFTNVYYDISRSGQSVCTDSGSDSGCTGVNSGNGNPNYFKNNKVNAPLNAWNFSGVWTRTASYPVFGIDPGDPTSSGSGGSVSAPSCGDAAPTNSPDLFQLHPNGTSVTLYFVPVSGPNNKYYVSYGLNNSAEGYGTEFSYSDKSGVIPLTVNALFPGTWYFKVRGGNGCMPGNWSQVKSVQVGFGSAISSFNVLGTSTVPTAAIGKCTDYKVKPGDSLWKIASINLGNGANFQLLMQQNKLDSNLLQVGQSLKVGC